MRDSTAPPLPCLQNFVASNLRSVARASIFAGRTTGGEREGRKSTFEREARKSGYERFSATEDDRGLLGSARNTQNGEDCRALMAVSPRGPRSVGESQIFALRSLEVTWAEHVWERGLACRGVSQQRERGTGREAPDDCGAAGGYQGEDVGARGRGEQAQGLWRVQGAGEDGQGVVFSHHADATADADSWLPVRV